MGRLKAINGIPVRGLEGPAVSAMRDISADRAISQFRSVVAQRPISSPRRTSATLLEAPNLEGLYPYQATGVEWLRTRKRGLLGDEMGTGKTVQVLRALPNGEPSLIVCPAFLRLMWADEAAKWRPELRVVLSRSGEFVVPRLGELGIVSYESLPDPAPGEKRCLVPVQELYWSTLVLDEAHYAKNYKTARTAKVRLLANQCARVWALTGTPLLGHPLDLWGVLSAAGLAFEAFGDWPTFLKLFGGKKGRFGLEFQDEEHTDEDAIRACLARVMLRRRREDVLPDLPRKQYRLLPVEIPESARKKLDAISAEWEKEGRTSELPPLEAMSAVRAELARHRIQAMLQQVAQYEATRTPLVVFSAHTEPVLALAGREGWGVITGETDSNLRRTLVDAFQTGLLSGLALTIQAGGTGLTLTRASHMLMVDRDWTPGVNSQAEDRLVRIGQTAQSVLVTIMVSDHPLERRIHEILDNKTRLIDATVG